MYCKGVKDFCRDPRHNPRLLRETCGFCSGDEGGDDDKKEFMEKIVEIKEFETISSVVGSGRFGRLQGREGTLQAPTT